MDTLKMLAGWENDESDEDEERAAAAAAKSTTRGTIRASIQAGISSLGLVLPGVIWHLVPDKEFSKVRSRLRDRDFFRDIVVKPRMIEDHKSSNVLETLKRRCEQKRDKVRIEK